MRKLLAREIEKYNSVYNQYEWFRVQVRALFPKEYTDLVNAARVKVPVGEYQG
jgi:hypothetical protein